MEPTTQQHPSRTAPPEHRWPPVVALVIALVLYAALPGRLLGVERYVVVILGLFLLVPLIVENPRRFTRRSTVTKWLSIILAGGLVFANQVALVILVVALTSGARDARGLLIAAVQIWAVNVIGFTTLYWEIDRGGPVERTMAARADLPAADFRFPQDQDDTAIDEVARRSSAVTDWTPRFVDYFYTTISNSMAFSATDAMPLSTRVKLLMALQALGGFVILALVIARSVNILGS